MPVQWFARYKYPTLDYVRKLDRPVLIIHSRADEIIPFEFGLQLYEAANEPKRFIEISGSHNDGFLVSGETYRKAWTEWIELLETYQSQSDQLQAS